MSSVSNDIVLKEKTELVPNSKFNRVNFEEPYTISTYGQDVVSEIEKKITDVSGKIGIEQKVSVNFKDNVDNLSDFSNNLDKIEERRNKQDKSFVAKKFNQIREKIVGKTASERLSYNNEYKKYADNVDNLVSDVETMFENAKNDFILFDSFIKSIKPYIETLREVYEFGEMDKDDFEKEVIEIEQKSNEEPDNIDLKREACIKRQILNLFNEKLYNIQKSRTAINQVTMEWTMRQINAVKQLTEYQNFLSLDKSILKLNGTALVGAKKQKEEIETFDYLVTGVNKAILETSRELNEVIKKTNEVTMDGNIKLDTYTSVDEYLKKGQQLLIEGAEEKKQFIEKSSEVIETLTNTFNEFNLQVKESLLLDANNVINSSQSSPKVKSKKGKK